MKHRFASFTPRLVLTVLFVATMGTVAVLAGAKGHTRCDGGRGSLPFGAY